MKQKNVMILGGLGFIGKNLYTALLADGYSVTIVADRVDDADGFLTHEVKKYVVQGSILDRDFLEKQIAGFDIIYSLAGRSGASDSIRDPYADLDRNLKGHLNILEACRKHNPNAIIVFPSSRLVYGKPKYNPVNEVHPLTPESIYAIHKLTVEHYYLLYQQLYNIKSVILRISNPYGPYQKFGSNHYGILNWFVHKALTGEVIEIYGEGEQKRDFLHIDDLVNVLRACIHSPVMFGKIYNVGFGRGISIRETVELIVKHVPGSRAVFKPWPEVDRKIETGDYISDISKLAKDIGWSPAIGFEEGIQATVRFYDKSRT